MEKRAQVGVGVLIEKDGKILLQKRVGSHGVGTWSCPGGHIDFGESLEKCAIRETQEEVGIAVTNVRFKTITNDIFPEEGKHYITIWMQADYDGGEPHVAASGELTEVQWFDWDKLPSPLFQPLQNLIDGKGYK